MTITGGMTLRDWFAGQALTGIAEAIRSANLITNANTPSEDIAAKWAFRFADAMLAARKEGGK
jgi:hypothetical protein